MPIRVISGVPNRSPLGNADVEVRGEARVGDRIETGSKVGAVREDDPAGGAAKALVGAHRHQVSALGERVRPSSAGEQAADVGGIEEDACIDAIGDLADLGNRMGSRFAGGTRMASPGSPTGGSSHWKPD